jgi:CDI immunity protein
MELLSTMPKRIVICDDWDPKFPIQAFFNAISDSDFVTVVSNLMKQVGHCDNDACCIFPSSLDPDEEVFEGVRFSLFNDRIVIDNSSFLSYLALACESYVGSHPNDNDSIQKILESNSLF